MLFKIIQYTHHHLDVSDHHQPRRPSRPHCRRRSPHHSPPHLPRVGIAQFQRPRHVHRRTQLLPLVSRMAEKVRVPSSASPPEIVAQFAVDAVHQAIHQCSIRPAGSSRRVRTSSRFTSAASAFPADDHVVQRRSSAVRDAVAGDGLTPPARRRFRRRHQKYVAATMAGCSTPPKRRTQAMMRLTPAARQ